MTHSMTPPRPVPAPEVLGLALELVAATYRTPDAALRDDLATGAYAEALATLAEATGATAPDVGGLEWSEVQSGHVELFVTSRSGVVAPPYVGYAADGELLGPTTDALRAFYAAHGLEVAEGWADLPDHLAAVAEAGALLLAHGRPDAAQALVERFLFPWFQRYADAVVAADVSGLYGPVTEFLRTSMSEVACEAAA